VLSVAVFVGLLVYGFVWPLRRRVTDAQVAMYLEECDPTLEAAIISAVEATSDSASTAHSPRLVEKLVEQAMEQCRSLEDGRAIERSSVRRHSALLAAIAAVTALIVAYGPAYLRHGLSALLVISRSAEASSPYSIEVTPGNTKVPRGRGSGREGEARRLHRRGRQRDDADGAERAVRSRPAHRLPADAGHIRRSAVPPRERDRVLRRVERRALAHLQAGGGQPADGAGARGRVPLPRVYEPAAAQGGRRRRCRNPRHRGRAPRRPDDDHARRPHRAQRRRRAAAGAQGDGSLIGSFKIDKQGFYRIELTGPQGEKVEASPQYTIDVIDDQAPSVRFTKPGRDSQASPVEELFLEARADDDYGVKSLQLFYSVNGSTPKTIGLFGGSKPMTEVSAGHTIYLEELGLKPGDFVSYYAKASDIDAVQGSKTTTSDIYFVQIRPFKKDYKPAQSQAMGGGGGGGAGPAGRASCRSSSARSSRRPSTSSATRRRPSRRSSARTSCSSTSRRRSCVSRSRNWSAS
jgi:hypothetical protein